MSKWNKGLMTAMEEFEEAEQTAVTGMDSADNEVLEMTESAAIMVGHSEAIDEAVGAAVDLQSIADSLKQESKLCTAAAKIAAIATESAYKRAGIRVSNAPSFESFKSCVALEDSGGIIATARRIWEAIKKAVMDAGKWIKDFFKNLFSANAKLEKRGETLKDKVEKLKKENKINSDAKLSGTLAKELTIDGLFPGTDLAKHVKDFQGVVYNGNAALQTLPGILNAANITKDLDVKDVEQKMHHALEIYPKGKQFLGTRMFVSIPSEDNPLKMEIAPFNTTPYKDIEQIDVISTDHLTLLLDETKAVGVNVANLEAFSKNYDNMYKGAEEKLNKMSKEHTDSAELPKIVKLYTNLNSTMTAMNKALNGTAVLVIKAIYDYVEKCVIEIEKSNPNPTK